MDDGVETLRFELDAVRQGRVRWRCPSDLRERVVSWARREIGDLGRPRRQVARDLGLSEGGLGRWLKAQPALEGRFRRVELVRESVGSGDGLVLVTPSGYRVEGLSLAAVAALVARL